MPRDPQDESVIPVIPSGVARLSPEDDAAVEALIDAGFNAERTLPPLQARARRAAAILELLTGEAQADAGLVDATMLRAVRAAAARAKPHAVEPRLTPQDELALESWVMSGYDAARVPGSLRARAQRHAALAALVVSGTDAAGTSTGLVDRTIARVQGGLDAQRERMRIDPPVRRGLGIRLADLVSAAAVLLIGASVVWPVVSGVREQSRRLACHSHLGGLAGAFGQYALDHDSSLPVVARSLDGSTYWNVGDPAGRSNSANLYHLARTGYTSVESLACPGNPEALTSSPGDGAIDWPDSDSVSYSYQNMFGGATRVHARGSARGDRPAPSRIVVLSDRSPVIVRTLRGEWIDPFENSLNHAGNGQHILFDDGSAAWTTRPQLDNGDLIWLPRPIEDVIRSLMPRQPSMLKGTETPGDGSDAFVVP